MAARDGHTGAGAQQVGGEIHHGRGHHADVDHIDPSGLEPRREGLGQALTRESAITAHHTAGLPLHEHHAAQRLSNLLHGRIGQRLIDDTTNVVGLKNGGMQGG